MRILIIEDEKRLADSIKKGLEQESYAVDVSYEGTDGMGMALIQDYDLIILDLFMPGMDGFEVCKRIKENPLSSQIKILAITGYDTEENKDRILEAGADGYVVKPFKKDEFIQQVEDFWVTTKMQQATKPVGAKRKSR